MGSSKRFTVEYDANIWINCYYNIHTNTHLHACTQKRLAPESKMRWHTAIWVTNNNGGRSKKKTEPKKNKRTNNIEIASKNTKTFEIHCPKIRDQELRERERAKPIF